MHVKNYAPTLLRLAMASVVLWFGVSQLLNPSAWTVWLPSWVNALPITSVQFVLLNGVAELVLGALLLAGLFTRLAALILSLHMLVIAFHLGYTDVGVRDAGLALATLAVAMHGSDYWCLDSRLFGTRNRLLKLLLWK
jgi:uncharacterized membrane protein YphA (DoxX/SURF4 family)